MKITAWHGRGELLGTEQDDAAVLYTSGRLLDKSYSGDIIGYPRFQGDDGKWYTVVVEAQIVETDSPEES